MKPKAKGGTDELSNLQCICGPCHAEKTAAEHPQARKRLAYEQMGFPIW